MKAFIIEKDLIRHNIEVIKSKTDAVIWGVLKYDGYGMGLVFMAQMMKENGITHFAVSDIEDVEKLRENGFIDEEILLLQSTTVKNDIKRIIDTGVIATIGSIKSARMLQKTAYEKGTTVKAHLKVDTGMGRYGFLQSQIDDMKSVYNNHLNIQVTGIYSHFSCAFCSKKTTFKQAAIFKFVVQKLKSSNIDTGMVHISNTSALFRYGSFGLDAVRVGSAFIGGAINCNNTGLKNPGHLECEIVETKWLPKGFTIGYSGRFKTKKPMRIAIIPTGSYDGFMVGQNHDLCHIKHFIRYILVELKNWVKKYNPSVSINGKSVPIRGRVGHGHVVADITDLDCGSGEVAVINVGALYINPTLEKYYV